ncbi:hypothetical protein ACKWTF_001724 [Chironomus riparius]
MSLTTASFHELFGLPRDLFPSAKSDLKTLFNGTSIGLLITCPVYRSLFNFILQELLVKILEVFFKLKAIEKLVYRVETQCGYIHNVPSKVLWIDQDLLSINLKGGREVRP